MEAAKRILSAIRRDLVFIIGIGIPTVAGSYLIFRALAVPDTASAVRMTGIGMALILAAVALIVHWAAERRARHGLITYLRVRLEDQDRVIGQLRQEFDRQLLRMTFEGAVAPERHLRAAPKP